MNKDPQAQPGYVTSSSLSSSPSPAIKEEKIELFLVRKAEEAVFACRPKEKKGIFAALLKSDGIEEELKIIAQNIHKSKIFNLYKESRPWYYWAEFCDLQGKYVSPLLLYPIDAEAKKTANYDTMYEKAQRLLKKKNYRITSSSPDYFFYQVVSYLWKTTSEEGNYAIKYFKLADVIKIYEKLASEEGSKGATAYLKNFYSVLVDNTKTCSFNFTKENYHVLDKLEWLFTKGHVLFELLAQHHGFEFVDAIYAKMHRALKAADTLDLHSPFDDIEFQRARENLVTILETPFSKRVIQSDCEFDEKAVRKYLMTNSLAAEQFSLPGKKIIQNSSTVQENKSSEAVTAPKIKTTDAVTAPENKNELNDKQNSTKTLSLGGEKVSSSSSSSSPSSNFNSLFSASSSVFASSSVSGVPSTTSSSVFVSAPLTSSSPSSGKDFKKRMREVAVQAMQDSKGDEKQIACIAKRIYESGAFALYKETQHIHYWAEFCVKEHGDKGKFILPFPIKEIKESDKNKEIPDSDPNYHTMDAKAQRLLARKNNYIQKYNDRSTAAEPDVIFYRAVTILWSIIENNGAPQILQSYIINSQEFQEVFSKDAESSEYMQNFYKQLFADNLFSNLKISSFNPRNEEVVKHLHWLFTTGKVLFALLAKEQPHKVEFIYTTINHKIDVWIKSQSTSSTALQELNQKLFIATNEESRKQIMSPSVEGYINEKDIISYFEKDSHPGSASEVLKIMPKAKKPSLSASLMMIGEGQQSHKKAADAFNKNAYIFNGIDNNSL